MKIGLSVVITAAKLVVGAALAVAIAYAANQLARRALGDDEPPLASDQRALAVRIPGAAGVVSNDAVHTDELVNDRGTGLRVPSTISVAATRPDGPAQRVKRSGFSPYVVPFTIYLD